MVVFPLTVPNVVAQFLVGRLSVELSLSRCKACGVLHHGSGRACDGSELVEACQFCGGVRSFAFAAYLCEATVFTAFA